MLYESLFRGLHDARVRYLVVGAVALNLHGVPRMTADLDLLVDLADANLRAFIDAMTALGYRPRVPVRASELLDPLKRREWKETKNMIVFTWIHSGRPYEEVDVFIENPLDFASAFAQRKTLPIQNYAVHLAAVSDLIDMKRGADREQDRSDIQALERLQKLERGES